MVTTNVARCCSRLAATTTTANSVRPPALSHRCSCRGRDRGRGRLLSSWGNLEKNDDLAAAFGSLVVAPRSHVGDYYDGDRFFRRPPLLVDDHLDRRRRRCRRRHALPSPSSSSCCTARRALSAAASTTTAIISPEDLEANILRLSTSMARGLTDRGYWTNFHDDHDDHDDDDHDHELLPRDVVTAMRRQAIALRFVDDRFEQSFSERIVPITGEVERFDKPGVYACEPDGHDYHTAPDILHYIATVMRVLPHALNDAVRDGLGLRDDAFNAKLAVTGPGGSKYPRHVDNVSPSSSSSSSYGGYDARKLTAILYLNPNWKEGDGGELRLYLDRRDYDDDNKGRGGGGGGGRSKGSGVEGEGYVDLSPRGGRLVLFWSDESPHEVLENAPHVIVAVGGSEDDEGSSFDRYALTIWVPSDDASLGRSFVKPR